MHYYSLLFHIFALWVCVCNAVFTNIQINAAAAYVCEVVFFLLCLYFMILHYNPCSLFLFLCLAVSYTLEHSIFLIFFSSIRWLCAERERDLHMPFNTFPYVRLFKYSPPYDPSHEISSVLSLRKQVRFSKHLHGTKKYLHKRKELGEG